MLIPKIRTEVELAVARNGVETWTVRVYGPRDVQLERQEFAYYESALAFQLGVQAGVRALAAAREDGA